MPRSPAEIREELDAVKGKKGQGRKIGALKDELIEALKAQVDAGAVTISAGNSGSIAITDSDSWVMPAVTAPDAGGEEWDFVQKCIAELAADFRGITSSRYKKIYNDIKAKVNTWRMFKDIFAEIGPGGELPAFSAWGIDANTGTPLPPEPEPAPEPDSQESEEAPAPAPAQSAAQMPVRSKAPSRNEILSEITGGAPKIDPSMAPPPVPV